MARWLVPACGVLLAVLAAHGLVLWGISQELQAIHSVIQTTPDPLFTRQITQQGDSTTPQAKAPSATADKPPARPSAAPQARPRMAATPASAAPVTTTVAEPSPALAEPVITTLAQTLPASTASTALGQATDTASVVAAATTTATTTTSASADAGTSTPADPSSALAQVGQWPGDTRLSYQLGGYFRGDLHGSAQVQWTRLPASNPASGTATSAAVMSPSDRYQVRVSVSVMGAKPVFTSQGRIRADGLLPEVYEEQMPNGRRSAKLDAHSVVLHNGTRLPRPAAEPNAVQDTASQFVDLGHRFAHGRARLVPGESVRVWLARPGGLDEWIYDISEAQTLYLPTLGAVQAYHLKPRPLPNARGTITAEMWIAPSLQYLPVRVKVTLNSETHLDMMVKTIEQR
jgi:Protein of unknown function (DUF3108)